MRGIAANAPGSTSQAPCRAHPRPASAWSRATRPRAERSAAPGRRRPPPSPPPGARPRLGSRATTPRLHTCTHPRQPTSNTTASSTRDAPVTPAANEKPAACWLGLSKTAVVWVSTQSKERRTRLECVWRPARGGARVPGEGGVLRHGVRKHLPGRALAAAAHHLLPARPARRLLVAEEAPHQVPRGRLRAAAHARRDGLPSAPGRCGAYLCSCCACAQALPTNLSFELLGQSLKVHVAHRLVQGLLRLAPARAASSPSSRHPSRSRRRIAGNLARPEACASRDTQPSFNGCEHCTAGKQALVPERTRAVAPAAGIASPGRPARPWRPPHRTAARRGWRRTRPPGSPRRLARRALRRRPPQPLPLLLLALLEGR